MGTSRDPSIRVSSGSDQFGSTPGGTVVNALVSIFA